MNISELSRVIEQVGKDRGIKKEIIIEALEQAVLSAAQKKFGETAHLEAHYNPDSGEIELFQFKQVVEDEDDIADPVVHIAIDEARKLDPEVNTGDELGIKLDTPTFGRIDAQTAKQVIFQKVRDAERDIIYNEFIHRKGEVISGIARRIERGNLVIDLGKTDALLPRSEIIPGETFKAGDRVQAYLSDVVMTPRGPQLYMTRTSPKFLMKLFEMEVPEVADHVVEIRVAAREPGSRAKIAVWSKDRDVDPVGACVGMKGVRVQNVIHELRGEKIDIIPWNDNAALFVKSGLQPAEISSIKMDERNKTMEIVVEDNQLSLAIGKRGQNVRLAAQLTGWRLDIISKSKLQKRTADAIFNLQHIEGVNETLAHGIYQTGFMNVFQVAEAPIEVLTRIPGYSELSDAQSLKERAKAVVDKGGTAIMLSKDGTPLESVQGYTGVPSSLSVNTLSDGSKAPTSEEVASRDAKAQAQARLKQEMEAAGMLSKDTADSSNGSAASASEDSSEPGKQKASRKRTKSAPKATVDSKPESEKE